MAAEVSLEWKHSANADFLYKSMHDISVQVFGLGCTQLCKYFNF